MAPLSFLALLGAAYGSVVASPSVWAGALGLLAAAAFMAGPAETGRGTTAIGAVVLLFAAWMALTNVFLNPSYTAAAPYHAAFLAGGFVLGRRAHGSATAPLFGAALACAAALAAWVLWQKAHGVARPSALFETPATFAALANLLLLPGLVLVLAGRRNALLLGALALIAAALIASLSRGGWLAFLAGASLAFYLLKRARASVRRADAFAFLAVAVLVASASTVGFSLVGPDAVRSSVARLELYELALRSMTLSQLPTGYGYLGFYYLLEASRHAVASYESSISYFVHNDYLQTLLELGAPGFAALLFLVVAPVAAAARAAAQPDGAELIPIAAGSATFSMAVHALVDFPFYAPVCLLVFGAALGISASSRPASGPPRVEGRAGTASFTAKAVLAALALWLLGAPLAADLASKRAHDQWKRGATEPAAYWFEVARRLERRDWRYHWQAGQFWLVQALQNRSPEAARRADAAFADGVAANPRDVRSLLGRIETQRRLADVLPAPLDAATLRAWSEQALAMAPSDPAVHALRKRMQP